MCLKIHAGISIVTGALYLAKPAGMHKGYFPDFKAQSPFSPSVHISMYT